MLNIFLRRSQALLKWPYNSTMIYRPWLQGFILQDIDSTLNEELGQTLNIVQHVLVWGKFGAKCLLFIGHWCGVSSTMLRAHKTLIFFNRID